MDPILSELKQCLAKQLESWDEAKKNYEELKNAKFRQISSSGLSLQFNPARKWSASARVDKASIALRPCFLCIQNRPPQQISFPLSGGYELLINPYPILEEHFTVASVDHKPQSIFDCYEKLIEIAGALPADYMVFYNGPHSGASAPDHSHMQIGLAQGVPLVEKLRNNTFPDKKIYTVKPFGYPVIVIKGGGNELFRKSIDDMTISGNELEPRMNVVAFNTGQEVITAIIPRGKHRPSCYRTDGGEGRMVSPGAIDMLGLVITPLEKDFNELTEKETLSILNEVTPGQPSVKVGVMRGKQIEFSLNSYYLFGNTPVSGIQKATVKEGAIEWQEITHHTLRLTPLHKEGTFTLPSVTIGIGFHWERKEEETFKGSFSLIPDGDSLCVVNELPVEEYLISVLSSEMKSTASKEFLKAHAVISRSWLLAQCGVGPDRKNHDKPFVDSDQGNRHIKWYDHDQHTLFDVCADDHCQRYQGISRVKNHNVIQAVKETYGEILTYKNRLCDARFSKCCGGVSEEFGTCWQEIHYPYLTAVRDIASDNNEMPDLTDHEEAENWIRSTPISFCNTHNQKALEQVLNSYDQETTNFFRWNVSYSADEISNIVNKKTGIDFGTIMDLIPQKRGPSGRILELLIVGERESAVIGKELEIRRALSESHLLSSAFVVEKESDNNGNTATFRLIGAGWGHGVGLCQIGAAIMGTKGYSYKDILGHYYPGTIIRRYY